MTYALVRLDASPLVSLMMLMDALRRHLDIALYDVSKNKKLYIHNGHTTGWLLESNSESDSKFKDIEIVRKLAASAPDSTGLLELLGIDINSAANAQTKARINKFNKALNGEPTTTITRTTFEIKVLLADDQQRFLKCRKMVKSGHFDLLSNLSHTTIPEIKKTPNLWGENLPVAVKDPDSEIETVLTYTSTQLLAIMLNYVFYTIRDSDRYHLSSQYSGPRSSAYHHASFIFPHAFLTSVFWPKAPSRVELNGNLPQDFAQAIYSSIQNPDIDDSCFLEDIPNKKMVPRVSFGRSLPNNSTSHVFPLMSLFQTPSGEILTNAEKDINCGLFTLADYPEFGPILRVGAYATTSEDIQAEAESFYNALISNKIWHAREAVGLKGSRPTFTHIDRDFKNLNNQISTIYSDLSAYFKIQDASLKGHKPSIETNFKLKSCSFFKFSLHFRTHSKVHAKYERDLSSTRTAIQQLERTIESYESKLAEWKLDLERAQKLEKATLALLDTEKTSLDTALKNIEESYPEVKALLNENQSFATGPFLGMLRDCGTFKASIDKISFNNDVSIYYDEDTKAYKFLPTEHSSPYDPSPHILLAYLPDMNITGVEIAVTEPFINSYKTDSNKCPLDFAYVLPPVKFRYVTSYGAGIAFMPKNLTLGETDGSRSKVHPHTQSITYNLSNVNGFASMYYPGQDHYEISGSVCTGNLDSFLMKSMKANDLCITVRSCLAWLSNNSGPSDAWSRETKSMTKKITMHNVIAHKSPLTDLTLVDLLVSKDQSTLIMVFEDKFSPYAESFFEQFQGELPSLPSSMKRYTTYHIPVKDIPSIQKKLYINNNLLESYPPTLSSTRRLRSIASATSIPSDNFYRSLVNGYLIIPAPAEKQEEVTCLPT